MADYLKGYTTILVSVRNKSVKHGIYMIILAVKGVAAVGINKC
jgi:hypothetical protein